MTHYALAELEGDGTADNAFRPVGCDGDGWSMIDLRPDCTVADGLCLVASPDELPATAAVTRLGDDLDVAPRAVQSRTHIANRLGVNVERFDVRGMTVELLVEHARDDGTRWRPAQPEHDGVLRLYLGGLIHERPQVRGGATYLDSFPGTTAGTGLHATTQSTYDWTAIYEDSANELTQNGAGAIVGGGIGEGLYRAEVAASGVDTYAEIDVSAFTRSAGSPECAVYVRLPTGTGLANWDGYAMREGKTSGTPAGFRRIRKFVNGSGTDLGTTDTTPTATPFTLRVVANGSSISGYYSGALSVGPVTDTAVTIGNYGGVYGKTSGTLTITEWRFGDGTGPPPSSVAYVGAIPILS